VKLCPCRTPANSEDPDFEERPASWHGFDSNSGYVEQFLISQPEAFVDLAADLQDDLQSIS